MNQIEEKDIISNSEKYSEKHNENKEIDILKDN
jgi:hypothetical protein